MYKFQHWNDYNFIYNIYARVCTAPIALGGRTSSTFYTYRTRTTTMFVKKSVKMHSVAYQLSVKQVFVATFWNFFCISIIHSKKILIKNVTTKFPYVIMYVHLSMMIFLPGEILSSFTMGKIHSFFFEFLSEISIITKSNKWHQKV